MQVHIELSTIEISIYSLFLWISHWALFQETSYHNAFFSFQFIILGNQSREHDKKPESNMVIASWEYTRVATVISLSIHSRVLHFLKKANLPEWAEYDAFIGWWLVVS